MKTSMQFLSDFTTLPSDPKAFCDAMTMSGSKVESYEITGGEIINVVTGRIISLVKHPDADKLVVCDIDVDADSPLQIVTGAPNVKLNDIVPVALHNSQLPGGVRITKGKLRGVESNGMLCSIQELGYTPDEYPGAPEDGIFILPPDTPIGVPVQEVMGLGHVVIDFEITSNRPDCFSVEGLGREAAITLNQPFQPIESVVVGKSNKKTQDMIDISIADPDLCFAYHGCVVTDVVIGASPAWMQQRLRDCGVKPINNIVDITNYVMLEIGQPMHAFDHRTLADGKLIVRRAKKGETLTTLDDNDHELDESVLVIADGQRPIGVAGVMGGKNSEIESDTQTILFESAVFEPVNVRRSAMKMGLRTEASTRYEKGLDVNNATRALKRACELVEQLGCGKVTSDPIYREGNPQPERQIRLRPDRVNRFLGTDIGAPWMEDLLIKLGCLRLDDNGLYQMPSYRPDLQCEADLAEEVARFYGYNRIPSTFSPGKEATKGGRTRIQRAVETLKDVAIGAGFYEICTYTFASPTQNDMLLLPNDAPERKMVKLRGVGEEDGYMRTCMLPSILQVASGNRRKGATSGRIFEIASVYQPESDDPNTLPKEIRQFAALAYDDSEERRSASTFYHMKGLASELIRALGLNEPDWRPLADPTEYPFLHPYRAAELRIDGEVFGFMGYIHPTVADNYETSENLVVLILTKDEIYTRSTEVRTQRPLPKYPPITRDLAVVVDVEVMAGELREDVLKTGDPLIESCEIFDVYSGGQVGEGKKSVAFNLVFRKEDATLQDEEVNPVIGMILDNLQKKYNASLR
ncbi:MAG: phenylalanine--tRNA ligase subunit beta [Fastidiosipilaceae bacterium]|jgi:phenylalanyl-tRNA synthetase beta chain